MTTQEAPDELDPEFARFVGACLRWDTDAAAGTAFLETLPRSVLEQIPSLFNELGESLVADATLKTLAKGKFCGGRNGRAWQLDPKYQRKVIESMIAHWSALSKAVDAAPAAIQVAIESLVAYPFKMTVEQERFVLLNALLLHEELDIDGNAYDFVFPRSASANYSASNFMFMNTGIVNVFLSHPEHAAAVRAMICERGITNPEHLLELAAQDTPVALIDGAL